MAAPKKKSMLMIILIIVGILALCLCAVTIVALVWQNRSGGDYPAELLNNVNDGAVRKLRTHLISRGDDGSKSELVVTEVTLQSGQKERRVYVNNSSGEDTYLGTMRQPDSQVPVEVMTYDTTNGIRIIILWVDPDKMQRASFITVGRTRLPSEDSLDNKYTAELSNNVGIISLSSIDRPNWNKIISVQITARFTTGYALDKSVSISLPTSQ